ncbi:MAG TPA: large conductance mechanosensitive channel protein MscL [Chitinophagaceae bacterium]|nr:large conductance mechanosensitive channel protein MscL [Chitinophagaceae bacterium]
MSMIREFKEFALRGNLVDIAVAFVMGAAFGKVITALTEGLVAPLISLILGGRSGLGEWVIRREMKDVSGVVTREAISLKWGAFLVAVLDFLIIAFVMFLFIRGINGLKRKRKEVATAPPEEILLLREICDSLKR